MVVDKASKKVICTEFSNGKGHDFRIFKEWYVHFHLKTKVLTDTGYQGLQKIHANSELPKKRRKNNPLSKEEKQRNCQLATQLALNENVIGSLKRFKIIADRYRHRRKRFGLRVNLIASIHHFEIDK